MYTKYIYIYTATTVQQDRTPIVCNITGKLTQAGFLILREAAFYINFKITTLEFLLSIQISAWLSHWPVSYQVFCAAVAYQEKPYLAQEFEPSTQIRLSCVSDVIVPKVRPRDTYGGSPEICWTCN